MMQHPRRRFLRATIGTGCALTVAGCLGDDDDDTNDDQPSSDVPTRIHDYLRDANEYERSMTDRRGEELIEVEVGTGDRGYGFTPTAVRIDTETTIRWVWTGRGGTHDVVSVGGSDFSFESDRSSEAGFEFSFTFQHGGVALYECRPHRRQGMLGAVEVIDPDHADDLDDS